MSAVALEPSVPTWRIDASCRGMDINLFFPDPQDFAGQARAKAVCTACPVKVPCGEFARAKPIDGVWGGLTERDRRSAGKQDEAVRCRECGEMFFLPPTIGGRLAYCTPECKLASRREQYRRLNLSRPQRDRA